MPGGRIILPWEEKVKPPMGTEVNLRHPLCPTLGFAFNEGGGESVRSFGKGKLANQDFPITGGGTWNHASRGRQIDLSANNTYIVINNIDDVLPDHRRGTIVYHTVQSGFISRGSIGQTTGAFDRLFIGPTYDSVNGYFQWGNNTTGGVQFTHSAVVEGVWAAVARQDDIEIWRDGVLLVAKGNGFTRPANTSAMRIGAGLTLGNPWKGSLDFCYFYDGLDLSPQQIQSITANPFQFYETRRVFSFAVVAAPAAAPTRMLLMGVGV